MPPEKIIYILQLLFSGLFFTVILSFADALAQRIDTAWFSAERKKIKNRYRYIFSGRSLCDHCRKVLSPVSLIPVAGWIFNRGICPQCRQKIPYRYIISETAVLIYGCLLFYLHENIIFTVVSALYLIPLVTMLYTDLRYMLVPDVPLILTGTGAAIEFAAGFSIPPTAENSILPGIVLTWYLIMHLLRILSGYNLGLADIRLTVFLSLALPLPAPALLPPAASAGGLVFAAVMKARRIAFAPFLVAAFFILRLVSGAHY